MTCMPECTIKTYLGAWGVFQNLCIGPDSEGLTHTHQSET